MGVKIQSILILILTSFLFDNSSQRLYLSRKKALTTKNNNGIKSIAPAAIVQFMRISRSDVWIKNG